jgi:6-phosphogluconate dehydrogenase
MQAIGFLGLGRMGANMVRRLRRAGLPVVAWNRSPEVALSLAAETGCQAAADIEALVAALPAPRIVWLMLPAGAATQTTVDSLLPLLTPGDLLVDGANAYYKDSVARAAVLAALGIEFVDAGVSGGVWGLDNGYCVMFGGSAAAAERVAPYMRALAPAPDTGWLHCGPAGAGHFVKMVHNGIEYGMMQSLAEGLALLRGKEEFGLDLAAVSELWRHGSVVRSWLLDLTAEFLARGEAVENIAPVVADSGEGRWTALEAIEQGIPAPAMSLALMMRFASQGKGDDAHRLLALMRRGFGGHAVTPADQGKSDV